MSLYRFHMDSKPRWDDLDEHGGWVEVEGGGLASPVFVKIARMGDGRRVVNGLVLGASFPRDEITADSLRSIKIAEILRELYDGTPPDLPNWSDFTASVEWGLMDEFDASTERLPPPDKPRNRKPVKRDLETFAAAYRRNLDRQPHTAMTATSRELNMSRATANRRAQACREAGLL